MKTGTLEVYCFLMLDGAYTNPDPKVFGFLLMLMFLLSYSKLGTVYGCFLNSAGLVCWMGFVKSNAWLAKGFSVLNYCFLAVLFTLTLEENCQKVSNSVDFRCWLWMLAVVAQMFPFSNIDI